MINMNSKMKLLTNTNGELDEAIINRLDNIIYNTRLINNCVIYDEDGLNDSDLNMDKILKFTKTFTAYEIGCNELVIEKINPMPFTKIATYLLDSLTSKFVGCEFVVYIIAKEEMVEIRFHRYRENEGFWLSGNIDEYDEPLLCIASVN